MADRLMAQWMEAFGLLYIDMDQRRTRPLVASCVIHVANLDLTIMIGRRRRSLGSVHWYPTTEPRREPTGEQPERPF